MKLLLLFLIAFQSEASFMTKKGLEAAKNDEPFTVYTNKKACPGECFNVRGKQAQYLKPVTKEVEDRDSPIFREISAPVRCGAERYCREAILTDNFTCPEGESPKFDRGENWDSVPFDGWFLWCEKIMGYNKKDIEVLEEDADLKAQFEARKAAKEAKKEERENTKKTLKQLLKKNPAQWSDQELKGAVKFLLERI